MVRDNLFNNADSGELGSFAFDQDVANVFEDMLHRSIPYYEEVIRMTIEVVSPRLKSGSRGLLVDLGCSHGEFLRQLAGHLQASGSSSNKKPISLVGVDSSKPLLDKAKQNLRGIKNPSVRLVESPIESFDFQPCSAITSHYTLQFVSPAKRKGVLRAICAALEPKGVFVLSEKIVPNNKAFGESFVRAYHEFKMRRGYSELEIVRKQRALENVLVPWSPEAYGALLAEVGFARQEVFFQWYNFISIVAIK